MDYLRGTRIESAYNASSASALVTLVREFPGKCRVGLYHTPDLVGVTKLLCPPRFNEGFGLMHMKVYMFDEDVLLSGYVVLGVLSDRRESPGSFSKTMRSLHFVVRYGFQWDTALLEESRSTPRPESENRKTPC